MVATALLALASAFQIGLAAGARWGAAAYGGRAVLSDGGLPIAYRWASAVAALTLIGVIWVVLASASLVDRGSVSGSTLTVPAVGPNRRLRPQYARQRPRPPPGRAVGGRYRHRDPGRPLCRSGRALSRRPASRSGNLVPAIVGLVARRRAAGHSMDGAGDEASGHAERDARSRSWSRRPVLLGDGEHGLNDRSVEGTELSLVENNRVRLHHRVGHGLAEVVLRELGVVQVRAVDKCWQMLTTSTDASGAHLRLLSANATSIVVCTGSPQSGDERPMAESSRERRPAGGAQQQVGDRYVQGVGRVPRQCGSTGLDTAAPCQWLFPHDRQVHGQCGAAPYVMRPLASIARKA